MLQWLMVILLGTYLSCYGRHTDKRQLDFLNTEQPALLVFGAGWCGPCRAEITHINEIFETHKNEIEIQGFLVEGKYNGELPDQAAIDGFVDRDGIRSYPLLPDAHWTIFKQLDPPEGQKLPMLVFLDAQQNVLAIKQGSIRHDELTQLVQSLLLKGETLHPTEPNPERSISSTPAESDPTPTPTPSPTPVETDVPNGHSETPPSPTPSEGSGSETNRPDGTIDEASKDMSWPTSFPITMKDWLIALRSLRPATADTLIGTYQTAFEFHRDEQFMTEYFPDLETSATIISATFDAQRQPLTFGALWTKESQIPDGPIVRCTLLLPFSFDGQVDSNGVESACNPIIE